MKTKQSDFKKKQCKRGVGGGGNNGKTEQGCC